MATFKIVESVAGEEALINAENPQRALIKYLQHFFTKYQYQSKTDSWTFDFEIERIKPMGG